MLRLLLRDAGNRFYSVEISETLFGDYAVCRAWGGAGVIGAPYRGRRSATFRNLREAMEWAERGRARAVRRGFREAWSHANFPPQALQEAISAA